MKTTFKHAIRAACVISLMLTAAACGEPHSHADHGGDHADEYERGPHRGRMLRDGRFAVEITIFEDGVDPQFRVYPYVNDRPIDPDQVDLAIELGRLGGKVDRFAFTPESDFLKGDGVVTEPHSFDVSIRAVRDEKTSQWSYESHEGRTTIATAQADAAGVAVEEVGPATIKETIALAGRIELQPQGRADVAAWFPGRITEMTKKIGDSVEKGDLLARVTATTSLQTYDIPAPISGMIMERRANVGDVAQTDPIYIIADTTQIHAELFFHPKDAMRIRQGQSVTVAGLNGEKKATATIEIILPTSDTLTQTTIAHVELPNTDNKWRPGEAIEGIVTVATKDVPLAVKTKALQRFRDFTVVYARVGETYEVRMLELGQRTPEWTEVLGGIDPGETYVTQNAFLIRQDVEKSGASHDH